MVFITLVDGEKLRLAFYRIVCNNLQVKKKFTQLIEGWGYFCGITRKLFFLKKILQLNLEYALLVDNNYLITHSLFFS